MKLRIVGKIGFLLVIIGFFMPTACNLSGFQLAKILIEFNPIIGILMYFVFISAIIGIILGILLLKNIEVNMGLEWLCLITCIASGLILYLTTIAKWWLLQSGAYMILTGWIVAFLLHIISSIIYKKKRRNM